MQTSKKRPRNIFLRTSHLATRCRCLRAGHPRGAGTPLWCQWRPASGRSAAVRDGRTVAGCQVVCMQDRAAFVLAARHTAACCHLNPLRSRTFCAMNPLLPTPVKSTLPRHARQAWGQTDAQSVIQVGFGPRQAACWSFARPADLHTRPRCLHRHVLLPSGTAASPTLQKASICAKSTCSKKWSKNLRAQEAAGSDGGRVVEILVWLVGARQSRPGPHARAAPAPPPWQRKRGRASCAPSPLLLREELCQGAGVDGAPVQARLAATGQGRDLRRRRVLALLAGLLGHGA